MLIRKKNTVFCTTLAQLRCGSASDLLFHSFCMTLPPSPTFKFDIVFSDTTYFQVFYAVFHWSLSVRVSALDPFQRQQIPTLKLVDRAFFQNLLVFFDGSVFECSIRRRSSAGSQRKWRRGLNFCLFLLRTSSKSVPMGKNSNCGGIRGRIGVSFSIEKCGLELENGVCVTVFRLEKSRLWTSRSPTQAYPNLFVSRAFYDCMHHLSWNPSSSFVLSLAVYCIS